MFSALKKQGVDEVAQLLWQWAHPQAADAPDGPDTPAPQ
jgi:GTP-binding protein